MIPKNRLLKVRLNNGKWEWSFVDHKGVTHSGTAESAAGAKEAAGAAAQPIAAEVLGQDAIDAMPAGLGRNAVCLLIAVMGESLTGKMYLQ